LSLSCAFKEFNIGNMVDQVLPDAYKQLPGLQEVVMPFLKALSFTSMKVMYTGGVFSFAATPKVDSYPVLHEIDSVRYNPLH